MSELPNKKELEEACIKFVKIDELPKDLDSFTKGIACFSFQEGAHYQHQISYAQGISDVIDFMNERHDAFIKHEDADRQRIALHWAIRAEAVKQHFSAQLKHIETLNDERRV